MKLIGKSTLISLILAFGLISLSAIADDDNLKGTDQIITSLEGNVIYFVKPGDKVEKGAPLFFIRATDYLPGKIKQLKQEIVYYKKTYERNKRLAKTNAVSVQALDDSWHDYHNAVNELEIAKQQTENGFYTAPYDCQVVKVAVPGGSGIGDGNPVVWIKKIPASELSK